MEPSAEDIENFEANVDRAASLVRHIVDRFQNDTKIVSRIASPQDEVAQVIYLNLFVFLGIDYMIFPIKTQLLFLPHFEAVAAGEALSHEEGRGVDMRSFIYIIGEAN